MNSGISCALDIAIPGLAHLVLGRQVEPQLEAFHQAFFLLGQFAVHQAATGRHPLHAAVGQQAFVAGAVAVPHAAGDHVGDGFEAAVRMVRKAADVVAGVVAAEGVEHQVGVEPLLQGLLQHARELDAVAVAGRDAGHDLVDARAGVASGETVTDRDVRCAV